MRFRAVLILVIIAVSLLPVYSLNKYLQQLIRPRESMGRLMGYILVMFLVVFAASFLTVIIIKNLFPSA